MKPAQDLCHRFDTRPVTHLRSVDQDDRKAERAGSLQLGHGTGAAGVFGDDMADAVGFQQGQITLYSEGAAQNDRMGVGQRQQSGRIDKAQKVMMLGLYGEIFKVLPPDGKEDAGGFFGQSGDRSRHVGHFLPAVLGAGHPWLTLQREQRHVGDRGGLHRVIAHLRGKWVGGVDQVGDGLGAQIGHQSCHTAKAADALRQGLGGRRFSSPGVRENARNALIGQGYCQSRSLSRAAEQKDAGHG